MSLSTSEDLCAFILPRLDVTHDAVELSLRNLGTLERILLEGVSDLEGLNVLRELVDELVVDGLLDEDTGSRAATFYMGVGSTDANSQSR